MAPAYSGGELAAAFIGGFFAAVLVIMAATFTFMRLSDVYGLGHWKLNVKMPLSTMWMNLGYWTSPSGEPVHDFEEACAGLLRQLLDAAGLTETPASADDPPRRALGVLDLGFGCGEQTCELARLAERRDWDRLRYVGLSLNQAQVHSATRKVHQHASASSRFPSDAFTLLCADAARPDTWTPRARAAVDALADESLTERWLVALDCLYHFKPSRRPIFEHAARGLDANLTAFDLILNDKASWRDTWVLRAIGIIMGCPLRTFLTEDEYREQLVECGYDRRCTVIRDVSDHVFPGVVRFINDQERALGQYGISLGGYKLAGRLFQWFGTSKVVRASVVVARTKGKSS